MTLQNVESAIILIFSSSVLRTLLKIYMQQSGVGLFRKGWKFCPNPKMKYM